MQPTAPAVRPPRGLAAFTALGCLALGGWLSWHHPLAPVPAVLALMLWSAIVFLRPVMWLFVVPALLPVIDFASWTGWLIVEEFDILVLGAAAGAYASMARRGSVRNVAEVLPNDSPVATQAHNAAVVAPGPPAARLSIVSVVLIGLFGVSTAIALYRGIGAAGTMEFGWFDGYYDAANSLRIAKSYLLALLMLPPLLVEMRRSDRRAIGTLTSGLAAGLGFASLAVLWERLAFPGLLNFSSDYRATALFWEMHVGGAALDGFLAMTLPFAIAEVLCVTNRVRWLLAGAIVLIAGYACLVTFSRGVYLAVPVSLVILAMLLAMRGDSWSLAMAAKALGKGFLLAFAMAAMSYLVFRAGGYRALLAMLGVFAMTLPLSTAGRDLKVSGWIAGLCSGALIGAAGSVVALLVPKGTYLFFGLAFVCCALLVWYRQQSTPLPSAIAGLGAYVWLVIAAAGVALGWGGVRALHDMSIVLLLLMALAAINARARAPLWPRDLRTEAGMVGVAAMAGVAAAVFSGGAYMGDRFSSIDRDLAGRLQHWHDGISMLKTPADGLLGKGAGRFPQNYFFSVGEREFPGSSSMVSQNGERFLALSGPRHEAGFGELFRVAQRVQIAPGEKYSVVLDARASIASRLHVEVCERHLLYIEECAVGAVPIPATGEFWRRQVVALDGAKLTGGPWFAPRPAFFALAAERPGVRIEIDNVGLIGADGRELIANGRFVQGMAGWFTTSDRFHLPWHIKNLGLNLMFDQGAVGLLLFMILTGGALYRVVMGKARGHPIAPFLAAALTGFLLVGLFDSLLDVPRLAFLYYLLILVSLALQSRPSAHWAERRLSPQGI